MSETPIKTREMRAEQKLHHWNSPKRQRTLSLTDAVWEEISSLAEGYKINRSEVIEIIARIASDRQEDLIEKRLDLLT
tara:strand:+ start:599 stop:832 length:234 start_codon:yes stop_codon:yes gene_type:complete